MKPFGHAPLVRVVVNQDLFTISSQGSLEHGMRTPPDEVLLAFVFGERLGLPHFGKNGKKPGKTGKHTRAGGRADGRLRARLLFVLLLHVQAYRLIRGLVSEERQDPASPLRNCQHGHHRLLVRLERCQ
jgi:hypothetical protein